MSITYARSQVVDFTLAYAYDPAALLVPYPQLASTITGLIRPYKYEEKFNLSIDFVETGNHFYDKLIFILQVWLGIVLSLFIVAFFVWLIKRIEAQVIFPNGEKYRGTFSDEAFFLFRVLANGEEKIYLISLVTSLLLIFCLISTSRWIF